MGFGSLSPRSRKLTSKTGNNGALTGMQRSNLGSAMNASSSSSAAGSATTRQTKKTVATTRKAGITKASGTSKVNAVPVKRSKESTATTRAKRTANAIAEWGEEPQRASADGRDDANASDAAMSHRSSEVRERAPSSESHKSVLQILEDEFNTPSSGNGNIGANEEKNNVESEQVGEKEQAKGDDEMFEDPPLQLNALDQSDDELSLTKKGRKGNEDAVEVNADGHNQYTDAEKNAEPAEKVKEAINEKVSTDEASDTSSNAQGTSRSSHGSSRPSHPRSSSDRDRERRKKKSPSKSRERPPRNYDSGRDRDRRRRGKSATSTPRRSKGTRGKVDKYAVCRVDSYPKKKNGSYADGDQAEVTGYTDADGADCGGLKKKLQDSVEEVQGTTQDILLSVFQVCCAFALRGQEINNFVREIDNARAELR